MFCASLLCGWGCKSATLQTRNGVYHTVKKGETLWRICYTYQVNMETVCRLNRIQNPERIEVDQRIFIPGATEIKRIPKRIEEPVQETRILKKNRSKDLPERNGVGESLTSKFIWPVKGMVSTWYGIVNGKRHDGIDIVAAKGTQILAAEAGKVAYSDDGIPGYGNLIIIQHPRGINTVYAHTNKNYVKVEDAVKKGQIIGEVGETGRAQGPHLHFEIRNGSTPVDPMKYLP